MKWVGRSGRDRPGLDDRDRTHRCGEEKAGGDKRAEHREDQLLKVVRNSHFQSPLSTSGPSAGHAKGIASAVPNAKNGGKSPFPDFEPERRIYRDPKNW